MEVDNVVASLRESGMTISDTGKFVILLLGGYANDDVPDTPI